LESKAEALAQFWSKKNMSNPISGIAYFFKGFSLITQPGIRRWVFIPFVINLLLFGALVYYAWIWFPIVTSFMVAQISGWLPGWAWLAAIVDWLLMPLVIVIFVISVFFVFIILATLIGGPFNDWLAEAVEKHLTGKPIDSPSESIVKIVIGVIGKQIGKLLYYLKWVIVLLIISFIPIINIVSPILWFLFGAWLASLEYADSPLGNHGYNPPTQRKILAQKWLMTLGFGSTVLIVMLIPLINFLVMPVAVAGMTAMWVEKFKE
jgi:CysZ protein